MEGRIARGVIRRGKRTTARVRLQFPNVQAPLKVDVALSKMQTEEASGSSRSATVAMRRARVTGTPHPPRFRRTCRSPDTRTLPDRHRNGT